MNGFLKHLAQRKYSLYRLLFVDTPAVKTIESCYRRAELMAKYEEICGLIEWLPYDDKLVVEKEFKELKS